MDGVKVEENGKITTVTVFNKKGAQALGKAVGKYITYCSDAAIDDSQIFDGRLDELSEILTSLLPQNIKSVLVAGLGNTDITADALGPKVVNYVLATRHIINDYNNDNKYFSEFFNVSSISTGVLGDTRIESAEIIKGVVKKINPRLGNTVQLCNAGISPGSGVGNHRYEISENTLGIPVISIGIPTVVSTSVIKGKNGGDGMFVTPREIDRIIEHGAKLIAMTVNVCLQKNIDAKDLFSLVG